MAGRVRTVERWWNGTWGRMARRDVWLRTDGQRWDVWVRDGGADGRNEHTEYDTEAAARAALVELLEERWDWRRLA